MPEIIHNKAKARTTSEKAENLFPGRVAHSAASFLTRWLAVFTLNGARFTVDWIYPFNNSHRSCTMNFHLPLSLFPSFFALN